MVVSSTLVAAANNDVLSAVYINPTFTNGAFTGVSNYALNVVGAGVFSGTVTGNGVTIGASDIRSSSNILTLGGTSEVIRIVGSTGNVGIGTSSPNAKLNVVNDDGVGSGLHIIADFNRNTSSAELILGYYADGTNVTTNAVYSANSLPLAFYTGATERMRITSGGNVGIGVSPSYRFDVQYDGCGAYVAQIQNLNSGDCGGSGCLILQGGTFNSGDTTSRYLSFRRNDGTEIGAVRRNGASNVAYDTSSDYRLKEDLKDFKGLDKLSRIKVYDFKWKNTTERMDGVLAHELQEVIPYAVGGEKDGVDEDGKIIIQGVDYSKLIPVLIKAIQEQQAQIEELKNKLNNV